MRSVKIYFIIAVTLFTIGGCGQQKQKLVKNNIIPVETTRIQSQSVQKSIHVCGTMSSGQISKLSFKVGGIVKQIHVNTGDVVKQNQVLAELYMDEINAKLSNAHTQYEKSKRDFERAKNLYKDNAISLQNRQDAESAFDAASATLQIAQFNASHAQITAPGNGKILKTIAEENEMADKGVPVVIFASTEKQWIIKTHVSDKDIVKLALGDSASVQFDAFPGKAFKCCVSKISESAESMSGLYAIELKLLDKPEKLITGLIGDIEIFPRKSVFCFLIPVDALVEARGKDGFIYKIDEKKQAYKLPVIILGFYNEELMVLGDLKDNDEIVTTGAAYLEQNSPVKITGSGEGN